MADTLTFALTGTAASAGAPSTPSSGAQTINLAPAYQGSRVRGPRLR